MRKLKEYPTFVIAQRFKRLGLDLGARFDKSSEKHLKRLLTVSTRSNKTDRTSGQKYVQFGS